MAASQRRSQLRQLAKHAALRFLVLVAVVAIAAVWASALLGSPLQETFVLLSIVLVAEPVYDVVVLLKVDRKQRAELPFLPPDHEDGTSPTAATTGAASLERHQPEPPAETEPAPGQDTSGVDREQFLAEVTETVDRVPAAQQADDEDVRRAVQAVVTGPDSGAESPADESGAPATAGGASESGGGIAANLDLDDGPEPEGEWPHIIEDPFAEPYPIVRETDVGVHEVFRAQQRSGTAAAAAEYDIPEAAVEEVCEYADANPAVIAEHTTTRTSVDPTTPQP